MTDSPSSSLFASWRAFGIVWTGAVLGLALLSGFLISVLDPYGLRASPGRKPVPIMDLNQRYMYPQIIRSGRYDSSVFGSSTIRLLDPEKLNDALGGRFANLGLNAGTPWEQTQLAELFFKHVPQAKTVIFSLDRNWCDADADEKRLTFRSFPPWLYEDLSFAPLLHMFNLKSFEIASRVLAARAGWMRPRIRSDGYEVFVPPDRLYDPERAKAHIRAGTLVIDQRQGAVASRTDLSFPALSWLETLTRQAPPSARLLFLFPPIHVAAQPKGGTPEALRDQECKRRIGAIAAARRAAILDMRQPSAITDDDNHYWDALHYRIGIADEIVKAVKKALP